MKYMGSKSRIAKHILPIIQKAMEEKGFTTYVEPFCGGCNVIDKVQAGKRIACDKQYYLIQLYENMCNLSQLPDFVTKEHYNEVKRAYIEQSAKFPAWYIGAIGFFASYNGKFFDGGYAGIAHTKIGTIRNYYDEARRNFEKQIDSLQSVEFVHGDYRETCTEFSNSLIYCDPPYKGTTGYKSDDGFCHDSFFEWCRNMKQKGNIVLISEHEAPPDFRCIWQMELKRTIDNKARTNCTEKLFICE